MSMIEWVENPARPVCPALLDLCAALPSPGCRQDPSGMRGVLRPTFEQGKSENFFKASSEAERENYRV